MRSFFRNNGLSITFFILFLVSIAGQTFTGYRQYNKELKEKHVAVIPFARYLSSGHFIQATFENWESEFLQMGMFVFLSIFLFQKGSSESKKFDGTDEVDKEPSPRKKNAPWPVKKGGVILKIYKHSLTIALVLLWLISFILHFYGSLKDENTQNRLKGEPAVSTKDYIGSSRFWFESFQNWQSEFLSVFSLVLLSVYLRQKGSSQSKPVDASYDETGE
ncbi:MAG TPA: DUF6766 family protein [Ferruginibacter sp.]|nr:DUF6766 family protein [Ferruginibacter sp.]